MAKNIKTKKKKKKKRERNCNLPVIVRLLTDVDPFMIQTVGARIFLVVRTEEVATGPHVVVSSIVQQELDHGWVLVHYGDV
jgi:hypothetical protein